jgi:hypothetical protein
MTRGFLKAPHTPDELAAFQEEMGEKAFLALENIR